MPGWVFVLMTREDAERYRREWGAHLAQLVEDREERQVNKHRRQLARAAVSMAITLRARRALQRVFLSHR
jgi:cell division ATPase FtsA